MAEVVLYKSRDQVLTEMLAELQGMIPDVYVGDDGVIRIIFEVEAGQFENIFLSNQLVLQDMFIATASLQGLIQHGTDLGVPMKTGTYAEGTITFEGQGGTYIPINSEVAYNAGSGADPLYFLTTLDGTIPNPGTPDAPVAAVGASGGLITGTYEYQVTFVTASGETLPSASSNAVTVSAQKINLSAIPVGGVGTVARKIYRDKNGAGDYRLVATINDNSTTTLTDNMDDPTAATGSAVPTVDTAHRITLDAQAENTGTEGNVFANTITELVDVPASITGIVASSVFLGGTDDEQTEDYRARLLQYARNPQTGSPNDLVAWAMSISGVETATAFPNNNLGTVQNGHVTVRITSADGSQPSAGLIQDVLDYLNSKDLANATIHVAGFDAVTLAVQIDVTTDTSYTLADVTAGVQGAITDYIQSIPVGGTFYRAGAIAAAMGVFGVVDASVTIPGNNQAASPTQKFVPGTITVV